MQRGGEDLRPWAVTTPEPNVPWPVRVIAVLFVLPFRLAWELLRLAGRVLVDYVLRPLAGCWTS